MKAKKMSQEGSKIVFQMSFSPDEFQRKIVESFRKLNPDDCTKPSLTVLSLSAILEQCENSVDVVRGAVQELVNDYCNTAMDELDIVPVSQVELRPLSSEINEPLEIVATVWVAPDYGDLSVEGLKVSYDEVVIDGTEIDIHLANMCASYGVATLDELCKKTGYYASVDEMTAAVQKSLERGVDQLNEAAREKALIDVLLKANPIDISEYEIERCVDLEIAKLKSQLGSNPGTHDAFDEDALRTAVRKDVAHVPHLNAILDRVARACTFDISEKDCRDEIAHQRAQSLNPEALESVDDTFSALQANERAMSALHDHIARKKALAHIAETAEFSVRAHRNVRDAHPELLRKLETVS